MRSMVRTRARLPAAVPVALLLGTMLTSGAAATDPHRWIPRPTATFQYQLSGTIDVRVDAKVFDVDAFDVTKHTIDQLHARGKRVICYVDAGSWESYRPDIDSYPDDILGKTVEGWPDERWLDIRRLDVLEPIMRTRVDRCTAKGFDGVEYDWTDSYLQDTGFPLTRDDQLAYDRWLAWLAHDRGLAVGLKNSAPLVRSLVGRFDFVITEQCFQYHECGLYRPFRDAAKARFDVEYHLRRDEFCDTARAKGISAIRKHLSLHVWRRAPASRTSLQAHLGDWLAPVIIPPGHGAPGQPHQGPVDEDPGRDAQRPARAAGDLSQRLALQCR